MKCSGCQIALPVDSRLCPKCGARQWRWLRSRALWIAAGALAAIVVGQASFSLGLIAWLVLILIATLCPWREWIDLPITHLGDEKKSSIAQMNKEHGPIWKHPRLWLDVAIASATAVNDQLRVWSDRLTIWGRRGLRLNEPGKRGPAVVAGSSVLVANESEVRAFDSKTGVELWVWREGYIKCEPTAAGEIVYIRTKDYLVALHSSSGEELWRKGETAILDSISVGQKVRMLPMPLLVSPPILESGAGEVCTDARATRRAAVRAQPVFDAVIEGVLERGDLVKLVDDPRIVDETVWYPITFGQTEGWVVARNLDLSRSEERA